MADDLKLDRLDEYEPMPVNNVGTCFFCFRCGAVVFACAPHTYWHNWLENEIGLIGRG